MFAQTFMVLCAGFCDARSCLPQFKRRVQTSRINRRALLFHSSSAVVASTVKAAALTTELASRDQEPSIELRALIEAHKTAYAGFIKAVHEMGGSRDYDRASQAEEKALLAICAYPAITEGSRWDKARYLLEIEARGELDLPKHVQGLLRSTMWKG
ncbi:hypothetical protein [Mesorhizobium sp. M2A.F.Ca.ET.042.01.1.1]|uniref:hypothetical protein n=1 Tax=Mesorhizobium sp. M2A.F.Ca.ET.042.01.1.1 TaxID=2496745 RepID=UPI001FDF8F28|nr:hypothetical protein [Mesorhizobium sp. M2A.F.Ca.ET.042.01.1.1]